MVGQAPIAGRVESILRVVPGVVRAFPNCCSSRRHWRRGTVPPNRPGGLPRLRCGRFGRYVRPQGQAAPPKGSHGL